MAIFTNKEDYNINLITQIAQLGDNTNEMLKFLGLRHKVEQRELLCTQSTLYAFGMLVSTSQEMLTTLIEQGGIRPRHINNLTDIQKKTGFRLSRRTRQQVEATEENEVIPADEIEILQADTTFRVIQDILQEWEDFFAQGKVKDLRYCPECKNIYLPNPTRTMQEYCSRRCSNRARLQRFRGKEKVEYRKNAPV